jgi:putative ABC transport system ATP-binding protein
MNAAATTSTDCAVQIRNLNYYFGRGELRKQVLYDINLDLPRGQVVIMTGPSGSGKTTLLTLIGALRSAQEGSLQVLNQEIIGMGNRKLVAVRRNIGFIFQAHNLFESLTATQNVEMAVELKGGFRSKRTQSVEILTQVGLENRADYKPDSLSGGQKQRVAIARALVNQPQLILADEPTGNLDSENSLQVVKILKKLNSIGITVIVTTHNEHLVRLSNHPVVQLRNGYLRHLRR